jgi:hypothetical protein
MTISERELTRPEFESVDLAVELGEARDRIDDAMAGLAASEVETEAVVNYRTLDGTLVAVVGTPGAREGSTLAYRTAPASDPATRKASRLREAIDPHLVG